MKTPESVLKAIDTVANYAEEIQFEMKGPLVQMLDEFYSYLEPNAETDDD